MAAGRMPTGRLEPDLSGPVVIASWIVTVRPDLRGAARLVLASIPGARVNALSDPLIMTTECDEADFPGLHRSLAAAPGVQSVSMVAAYSDPGPEENE
jgi:hypothetical protein